jgi:hypothetical protein
MARRERPRSGWYSKRRMSCAFSGHFTGSGSPWMR